MQNARINSDGKFDLDLNLEDEIVKKTDGFIDSGIANTYKSYRLSLLELKNNYDLLRNLESFTQLSIKNNIVQMAIITLYKCFNKNDERNQLDRGIFKSELYYKFNHLERIRNEYIAHDSSDYSNCDLFFVLNEKSQEIKLLPLSYMSFLVNETYIDSLFTIYEIAISHAEEQVRKVELKIKALLKDKNYSDYLLLEDAEFIGPNPDLLDVNYYLKEFRTIYNKRCKGEGTCIKISEAEYKIYSKDKKNFIIINIEELAEAYEEKISIKNYLENVEKYYFEDRYYCNE